MKERPLWWAVASGLVLIAYAALLVALLAGWQP